MINSIEVQASQLSSTASFAKARKSDEIFDFDLKTVQLGSGQPRGVITSRTNCTISSAVATTNSFCCTGRK